MQQSRDFFLFVTASALSDSLIARQLSQRESQGRLRRRFNDWVISLRWAGNGGTTPTSGTYPAGVKPTAANTAMASWVPR